MSVTSIRYHKDREATVFSAGTDKGRTGTAAFRSTLLTEGSRFAGPLIALAVALDRFAAEGQRFIDRLLPAALAEELRKLAGHVLSKPFQDAIREVQQGKRDYAARRTRISEPPSDLSLATEDRQWFRSLSPGDQAAWILAADRGQLAALIIAGRARFPTIPDQLWFEVVERHAVLAHVERTGLQADYQLKPTPNDPAAVGPDVDAAENAAREAVQRFHDDQRAIDDAEGALRSVIVATAVATDLSVEDAFKLLAGKIG